MARNVSRERAAQQRLLRRAERSIDAATLRAMSTWLDAVRFALVQELGIAGPPDTIAAAASWQQHRKSQPKSVTSAKWSEAQKLAKAAAERAKAEAQPRAVQNLDYAIDAAVQRSWGVWQNQLENQVLPTVSVAFGDAFQQVRRGDPQGAFAMQQQYLAEVSDRLKMWPDGAFEDIRPELLEALSEAETVDQMTDRIGRVLTIDARSRELRARINEVETALTDPDLSAADAKALRSYRRDLWTEHDESLNEWQWKARRIARTESHGAVTGGQLAAAQRVQDETGIRMWKRWLSAEDLRTRASHRVADGQTVPLDQPFRVGGFLLDHPADAISVAPHEVINCFVANTEVVAPDLIGSFRSSYTGPMVTVRMASGGVLTGTPNHPMLTERGWVGLGELNQGDEMIRAGVTDCVGARIDPEVEDFPSTLGEIHRALGKARNTHRVTGVAVDFHGDVSDGEVEVIRADRELRDRLDTAHREHIGDCHLERRNSVSRRLPSDSASGKFVGGSRDTSNCIMRGVGEPGALFGVGLTHAGTHGVGPVTACYPVGEQHSADDTAGNAMLFSEALLGHAAEVTVDQARSVEHVAALLRYARVPHEPVNVSSGDPESFRNVLRGLAGRVTADRVVAVEVAESWTGHVFTLQTGSAMFLTEGYIARNCRCTLLIYDDDELQDEFDEQGGKGDIEPGAVRIGPDDPERADEAIVQVAEREGRAKPKVGQRGEDAGQTMPDLPDDVQLTDERSRVPLPDVESASDERLADYLVRTDETDNPELRSLVEDELARRRDPISVSVDDWLDEPDGDPDDEVVDPGPLDIERLQREHDAAIDVMTEAIESGDEDRMLAAIDEAEAAERRLTEAMRYAETPPDPIFRDDDDVDPDEETDEEWQARLDRELAADEARAREIWGDLPEEPAPLTRQPTEAELRRMQLMDEADEKAQREGISYEQALAELQGLDRDQLFRREFVARAKAEGGLSSTNFNDLLDELHNRVAFDWLLEVEEVANGQTLNKRSRDSGVDAGLLWTTNDATARKHMSDEAAAWFDENGRITKGDLRAMIEDGHIAYDASSILALYATWPGRRLGGDYLA